MLQLKDLYGLAPTGRIAILKGRPQSAGEKGRCVKEVLLRGQILLALENSMTKFNLEKRIPSCFVTKGVLEAIEQYLKVDLLKKHADVNTGDSTYSVSIREAIGTETLDSVDDFTPGIFSDGTEQVKISWDNGYKATRLRISISFDREFALSQLEVDCGASTAKATAKGIADDILSILERHRNYNWLLNPFEFRVVPPVSFLVFIFLGIAATTYSLNAQTPQWYWIFSALIVGWIHVSSAYFRPFISFDTRRQQLFNKVWMYITVGTVGFVLFGTLLPQIRKAFVGF